MSQPAQSDTPPEWQRRIAACTDALLSVQVERDQLAAKVARLEEAYALTHDIHKECFQALPSHFDRSLGVAAGIHDLIASLRAANKEVERLLDVEMTLIAAADKVGTV